MYIPKSGDQAASVRGSVVESGANTYTENEIDTQLDPRTSSNIMLVTGVIFGFDAAYAASADGIRIHLARASQTAILMPNHRDYIAAVDELTQLVTSGPLVTVRQRTVILPIPYPIASNLFLAVQGVSLAAAATVKVAVCGYIKKASSAELLRVSL